MTDLDYVPESDTVLLWLARFPIEKNHPRPLTGSVTQPLTHHRRAICVLRYSLPLHAHPAYAIHPSLPPSACALCLLAGGRSCCCWRGADSAGG